MQEPGKPKRFQEQMKWMAGALGMPPDLSRGSLLVSMQGQEHLLIENFRGISSYTEEEILLIAKHNRICISGKKLKIDSYTKEEIEISGRISRLEYQ
jgi:sporulation protein YqfC